MFGAAKASAPDNRSRPTTIGGFMRNRRPVLGPRPRRRAALACAALAGLAGAAAAAPPYSVTRIVPHDPPRWTVIEGVALNQVGGVAGNDVTHGRPFRWSPATGLELLDDLPGGEEHGAQATDINDAGVVVGTGSITGSHHGGHHVTRPVAWMPGSAQPRDLGEGLNPKAHEQWYGYAYAINDAGLVSGVSGPVLAVDPFILDMGSASAQPLGDAFYPYMINESGATAGLGYDPASGANLDQYRAPDGRRVDLPRGAHAYALDNLGRIAGATDDHQAFVWREGAGLTMLPPLPGLPRCFASGLNDLGVAIGSCYYDEDQHHAVLWTPDGLGGYTAQDVRELVPPDARRPPGCLVKPGGGTPHCFGEDGVAINNAGQLLVNEHKSRHVTRVDTEPLLLTPPAR
jgi:hypothetical protein